MNILSARGRIKRLQFFIWSIVLLVQEFFFLYVISAFSVNSNMASVLLLIAFAMWIYMQSCLVIKRYHDLGKSGVNAFWSIIPVFNICLFFYLSLKKSDTKRNKYDDKEKVVFEEASLVTDSSTNYRFNEIHENNKPLSSNYLEESNIIKIRQLKSYIESTRISEEC